MTAGRVLRAAAPRHRRPGPPMNDPANPLTPLNRRMITLSIMLATIMQALDTTIANVALPHMQGSLSASQDQIAWVLTSYIVAAAIATPLTGWLCDRFGQKSRLPGLGRRLHARLGAVRRVDVARRRSSARACCKACSARRWCRCRRRCCSTSIRRHKHGQAMAIWGMGVMLGPIIGPGARRLADRELQLALGVLHQPADRRCSPSTASGATSAPGTGGATRCASTSSASRP